MPARHDLTTDPVLREQLLQVRRGTAFFARKLNELRDEELDSPSLVPGWSRRHVAAHIGYNARAIARLIEWARTGVETPMYESYEARNHEILYGATLSPIALRNLYYHAAIHLNVEWRDLPDEAWSFKVRTIQGREVPAAETVWMRSREIWVHAVDLANGASFRDIPIQVLDRLLHDIVGTWNVRGDSEGLVLKVSGPGECSLGDLDAENPDIISGTLADITAWASGRGSVGVTSSKQMNPMAPHWI